jgi:hypothetical protein
MRYLFIVHYYLYLLHQTASILAQTIFLLYKLPTALSRQVSSKTDRAVLARKGILRNERLDV